MRSEIKISLIEMTFYVIKTNIFGMESNLITFVPQQVYAFIVNGQKVKYCFILLPKGHFTVSW
jgi:hypothetical protein